MIGCFSAASNVTGILTDTNAVTACLHRNGALAFWDYATAGKEITKRGSLLIERFSFECRNLIGFPITALRDWLKKLAPLFHPIRSKTKTNQNLFTHVFPRFASTACNYYEF